MAPQRILILGAGELGLSVIEALAAHPLRTPDVTLTVLMRRSTVSHTPPSKAATVSRLHSAPISASFEPADVVHASATELATIFSRYDTIISCNGMGLPSGTQSKLSDAVLLAAQSKSQNSPNKRLRYFPWQFGMDYDAIGSGSAQDLFDEQLAVRAKLRSQEGGSSKVDWTIVSTGLFMSFLLLPDFGVVDVPKRTVRALGKWDEQITVTTPRDIGTAVAELVFIPPQEEETGVKEDENGRIVYVAGDTVSYADIAREVEKRFSWNDVTKELWDRQSLAEQTKKAEDGEVVMVKYRSTFAEGKGVAWDKAGSFTAARGLETMDLRGYLLTLDDNGEEKRA